MLINLKLVIDANANKKDTEHVNYKNTDTQLRYALH